MPELIDMPKVEVEHEEKQPANRSTQPQPTPKWAIHRRLYDWVLSLAHNRYGATSLFAISFAESSFFPIPPDVLQIALTLERRERAWYYATVSLIGSVLGAVLGYVIGWIFWELTKDFFFTYIFSTKQFSRVESLYAAYDFWIIFAAAFTPIPYKVITIAAGVCHDQIALWMLILASIVGRGARFYLVAGLLYWFGPKVKGFIDKYFNWICLAFTALLVGGFVVLKVLSESSSAAH